MKHSGVTQLNCNSSMVMINKMQCGRVNENLEKRTIVPVVLEFLSSKRITDMNYLFHFTSVYGIPINNDS